MSDKPAEPAKPSMNHPSVRAKAHRLLAPGRLGPSRYGEAPSGGFGHVGSSQGLAQPIWGIQQQKW